MPSFDGFVYVRWRGEFLNFFLVLWRILHSSSTCRGISELLIALVSSSCHPHHHGTQALTTSAYLGRLFVFVYLEALSTLRALVPSGCSPALRKESHLSSAQSPLRLGLCLHPTFTRTRRNPLLVRRSRARSIPFFMMYGRYASASSFSTGAAGWMACGGRRALRVL